MNALKSGRFGWIFFISLVCVGGQGSLRGPGREGDGSSIPSLG